MSAVWRIRTEGSGYPDIVLHTADMQVLYEVAPTSGLLELLLRESGDYSLPRSEFRGLLKLLKRVDLSTIEDATYARNESSALFGTITKRGIVQAVRNHLELALTQ